MPVNMVVGPPGSGKSFTLARIAARRLAKDSRPVFANFDIAGAQRFDIAEMADLPPCTLIVDEAQNWFHSRMWQTMPTSMLERWSQTRHMGWDIYLGTQHESNVDSVVRRVVQYGWLLEPRWQSLSVLDPRVRRTAKSAGDPVRYHRHPMSVHADVWFFPDFRSRQKGRRPIRSHSFPWSWSVADSYNTHEMTSLRSEPANRKR